MGNAVSKGTVAVLYCGHMFQKLLLSIIVGLVSLSTATIVLAHGNSFSYEETKEGYLIDIGHDEFIAADESVRFDFSVYPEDLESVEGEVFSDVWVTLTQDRKVFFAGGIDKPVFGTTGFTFAFPEEGTYMLSARFQKDGETVVATEFPITVIPSLEKKKGLPPFVVPSGAAVAGLLIGLAGGFIISNKRKA